MDGYRNYLRDRENVVIPRSTLRRWLRSGKLEIDDIHDYEFIDGDEDERIEMETDDTSNILHRPSDTAVEIDSDLECDSDLERDSDLEGDSDAENNLDPSQDAENRKKEPPWIRQELYIDSILTVGESVDLILKFFLKNSITKRCLDALLELLGTLLPAPHNLPRTRHQLYKLLNALTPKQSTPIKKHRFCEDCTNYLGVWSNNDAICQSCSGTNTDGLFVENDLRTLLVHAFEVRNLHKLMDEHAANANNDPGFICDITCGSEYKRLKHEVITDKYDVCLIWNTDGIPVASSSPTQLWPIQVQIVNIPPKNRRNFQFVCGLYYGTTKPNMLSFLQPFVATMKNLYTTGLKWQHPVDNTIMISSVIAPIATLDCPARAAVQNLKQFNGKYGCTYCEHPGSTCVTIRGFTHVYRTLESKPPARTHPGMIDQALEACLHNLSDVKGVKGPSIAALIPHFNIATGFVPDYMHSILLGVERMLCECWFGKGNQNKPYCVPKAAQKTINELLLNIKPPDCITRIPREITLIHFWKAKELSAFLLYYSPILMKDKIADRYYQHYLLLVRATQILLKSKISRDEILLAECMLNIFCSDIEKMYGLQKCTFNVHQLTHLSQFVLLWGPLWAWSAFPFEDGNGGLMKIKHGPNKIDVELLNTIGLINIMYILRHFLLESSEQSDNALIRTSDQQCQFPIAEAIEALIKVRELSRNDLHLEGIRLYSKIKIGKQTLTSVSYKKQVKRNNTCITWNHGSFFGIVQCFTEFDGQYYAIVRQLIPCNVRSPITHRDTGIQLSYIIPVRESGITHAVPVCDISGQLLKIFDNICLFPNIYEIK